MKFRLLTICLSAFTFFLTAIFAGEDENNNQSATTQRQLIDAVIVKVNGRKILTSDLNEMVKFLYEKKYGKNPPPITQKELDELYNHATIELVKIELIKDEAKAQQIPVTVAQVDSQLRRSGISPEEATAIDRKIARAEITFDFILAKEGLPPFRPTPKQSRDYYNQNKEQFRQRCLVVVRSIFLRADTAEDAAKVKPKAELFRQKILSKPKEERTKIFSAIAKEYSQDAYADAGGLIRIGRDKSGWFLQDLPNKRPISADGKKTAPIFPDQMYKAIKGLAKKGEVSSIRQSKLGFHILYLQDIKGGKQISLGEAAPLIQFIFEQQERKKRLLKWITKKWERSDVVWHDDDDYPLENVTKPLKEELARAKNKDKNKDE